MQEEGGKKKDIRAQSYFIIYIMQLIIICARSFSLFRAFPAASIEKRTSLRTCVITRWYKSGWQRPILPKARGDNWMKKNGRILDRRRRYMFKKNIRKERAEVYKSILVCTSIDTIAFVCSVLMACNILLSLSSICSAPCRCPSVLWMATELKVVLHDIGDELETLSLHVPPQTR